MPTTLVLTEDEALELLAFLVTAARTQLDEAAEYGPLRLLLAASRLADAIGPRVSPETRAVLAGRPGKVPGRAFRTADAAGNAAKVDDGCRAVAQHLVSHLGHETRTS